MSEEKQCTSGHTVPAEQQFCGTCGSPAVDNAPASRHQDAVRTTRGRSRTRVLMVVTLLTVFAGGAVTLALLLTGDEEAEGEDLTVRVRDTMGDCDEYTSSYVEGARVTVEDADGSIVGSGQTRGGGRPFEDGCAWEVTFGEIPDSVAYTVKVELPRGQFASTAPAPQELTFSRDELVSNGWEADLGKNF